MAKSKNASTHHLGRKIHRNGIHKFRDNRYKSLKGVNLTGGGINLSFQVQFEVH